MLWQPPPIGWLKCNSDVAIRQDGSYIVVSLRDSSSSLCMIYTERLVAMDPVVGEAFVLAEAVSLAWRLGWSQVLIECNSLVLCKDILSTEPSILWAASGMVEHVWRCLEECRD